MGLELTTLKLSIQPEIYINYTVSPFQTSAKTVEKWKLHNMYLPCCIKLKIKSGTT